jgi:hypothetical protein
MSKSKANAKARAAFLAGQQQAMMRMHDAQGTSVRIVGNVKNPMLVWTENLTLAEAIVTAEYQGVGTPVAISIVREGQQFRVDPKQLLRGEDIPLQAGDTIEIRP